MDNHNFIIPYFINTFNLFYVNIKYSIYSANNNLFLPQYFLSNLSFFLYFVHQYYPFLFFWFWTLYIKLPLFKNSYIYLLRDNFIPKFVKKEVPLYLLKQPFSLIYYNLFISSTTILILLSTSTCSVPSNIYSIYSIYCIICISRLSRTSNNLYI